MFVAAKRCNRLRRHRNHSSQITVGLNHFLSVIKDDQTITRTMIFKQEQYPKYERVWCPPARRVRVHFSDSFISVEFSFQFETNNQPVVGAVKDIVIVAESLGFDSWAGQIEHRRHCLATAATFLCCSARCYAVEMDPPLATCFSVIPRV